MQHFKDMMNIQFFSKMEIVMLLLYFLLFLAIFHLSKKLLCGSKHKNLPPSPPSLPIIGHLHLLKDPLHRTLAHISAQYGPVLFLRFGSRPVLVVSSPSTAEECLSKNDIIFANRPRLLIGKHLGHDHTTLVWASYGDNWRNLRRITTLEIFSTNRLQMFSNIHLHEIKSMIRRILHSQSYNPTVDMKSTFLELTLNIMMKIIAGKKYYGDDVAESEEAKRFKEIMREMFLVTGESNIGDFLPFVRWFGVKGNEKKLLSLKDKRDEFLKGLIEEHRKKRNSIDGEEEKKEKMTMIDVLLTLQDKEPEYYTDEMIIGMIWVLLAAGSDTMAGTMEWALALLLNNKEAYNKVQEEIDLHVEPSQLLNESHINKLTYLHRVITETLRMYPPGPLLIPHESSEECTIGGHTIPPGTILFVNLWAIHNDPNIWAEPNKFKPERFDGLKGARDGFKLLPFGSGRRGCPGEGLGMRVVGLALGSLIQCFDWVRVGEEMVDLSEGVGLSLPKAKPLEANCKPRDIIMGLGLPPSQ